MQEGHRPSCLGMIRRLQLGHFRSDTTSFGSSVASSGFVLGAGFSGAWARGLCVLEKGLIVDRNSSFNDLARLAAQIGEDN